MIWDYESWDGNGEDWIMGTPSPSPFLFEAGKNKASWVQSGLKMFY